MFSLILMMLFCLALAIFAVQNTTVVQIHFALWKTQNVSVAMLVVASAAIGMILSFFLSIPTHHRRRKQLKAREKELQDLRDAIGKH
jgi:uncharacterized integral membrane protein